MSRHVTPPRVRDLTSRLLAQNATRADRLVSDALGPVGARKWHFVVLIALTEGGPASQADLSRRTGVFRSDMVAVLNELAEQGYVERTPDPDDKRRNVVTVTDAGRRRLRQLDEIVERSQQELLAPLTAAERATLTTLLKRLLGDQPDVMAEPEEG
jgi:MarR family transcriptional regulator, lower aerobic nicotinate degradation pathway regulator